MANEADHAAGSPAVSSPGSIPPGTAPVSLGSQALVNVAVALLLPWFFQSFHYTIDVYPTYLLSKAWPIITLPLFVMGVAQRPPYGFLVLATFLYAIAVPPVMTMIYFDQGYLSSLTGTIKILPVQYYFSLLFLLLWLRPTPRALERIMELLGGFNLALLALLWVVVPTAAYRGMAPGEEISKLFLWETERGYRITLPLVFGLIFILYQFRMGVRFGKVWRIGLALASMALLVIAFKQRTVIAGIAAMMGLALLQEARPWLRATLIYGGIVVALALLLFVNVKIPLFSSESLGGSLGARELTVEMSLGFLAENPLRWIFGSGALTRASDTTFQAVFHHANFYLADIGLLGIVFEYGLLGGLLIVGIYIAAWVVAFTTPRGPGDGLVDALGDMTKYLLLTSPVLSLVFAPGEGAAILALLVYIKFYADR